MKLPEIDRETPMRRLEKRILKISDEERERRMQNMKSYW